MKSIIPLKKVVVFLFSKLILVSSCYWLSASNILGGFPSTSESQETWTVSVTVSSDGIVVIDHIEHASTGPGSCEECPPNMDGTTMHFACGQTITDLRVYDCAAGTYLPWAFQSDSIDFSDLPIGKYTMTIITSC